LAIGPSLVLVSCAVAFAQDAGGMPGAAPGGMPSADFLLSMGPYGALVWGAYLLGKGLKISHSADPRPSRRPFPYGLIRQFL
jgi:hypothetical protein